MDRNSNSGKGMKPDNRGPITITLIMGWIFLCKHHSASVQV